MKINQYPKPDEMPFCSCGNQLVNNPKTFNSNGEIFCLNCSYTIVFDNFDNSNNFIDYDGENFEVWQDKVFDHSKYKFVITNVKIFNVNDDIDPLKILEKVKRMILLL